MDPSIRIARFYGYGACLVALITFLVTLPAPVKALFDLADPMHSPIAQRAGQPSLASFDNYKTDVLRGLSSGVSTSASEYIPDDHTLAVMYDAARSDLTVSVRLDAARSFVANGLLLLVCVAVFASHWNWLRWLTRTGTA